MLAGHMEYGEVKVEDSEENPESEERNGQMEEEANLQDKQN